MNLWVPVSVKELVDKTLQEAMARRILSSSVYGTMWSTYGRRVKS